MQQVEGVEGVRKSIMDNGLKVVTEHIESVKSVAVGIWVKTGSRNESAELAGVTHFLEHMLFKGTENRSSYDIAMSMESVGGYLNAFTSSEYTCYYARCLNTQIDRALDVLTDMVQHATFPEDELQKEKKVVIEEMKMYRDSPDDYLIEQFKNQLFPNHPLGRPILGFEDTVTAFSREDLFQYVDDRYQPENIVVAIAGDIQHERALELVGNLFSTHEAKAVVGAKEVPAEYQQSKEVYTKKIQQTHLMLGRRGLYADHDDRYKLLLANTVLGGGMSSRLHQNVREKYGYCYSIQSFNQSYSDSGVFGIYVGTDADYVDHVRELIETELSRFKDEPIPDQELSEAKSQLKGKLLLSQENMSSRMSRLAKSELYYDRYITLDELVSEIDQVSSEEIQDFAQEFFDISQFSEGLLKPAAS
ncbi:MAG: M16 family metallopeptidase [Bacteroidota bacterium]